MYEQNCALDVNVLELEGAAARLHVEHQLLLKGSG